jgi:phosphomannomutase
MNAIKRLLPNATLLHCDNNPGFLGTAPEPIHRNLQEFSDLMKNNDLHCGLATDGDADRIGLYDSTGNFVDSHHIILLLIHYLVKYKKMKGKIVTAFSCSVKVEQICKYYGLEQETVQIGFKHISGKMIIEDILLGGEESGGIATAGHIPERDGIWMGLILFEFMVKSGKTFGPSQIPSRSGIWPAVAIPPDSSPPKRISSIIILPDICLKPICTVSCSRP